MSGSAVAKAEDRAMVKRSVGCAVFAACLVFALVNGQHEKVPRRKYRGDAKGAYADDVTEDMKLMDMSLPMTARMSSSSVRKSLKSRPKINFAAEEGVGEMMMDRDIGMPQESSSDVEVTEKLLVRRADIQIVTKIDVFAVATAAITMIERWGGYVENSRNENSESSSIKRAWVLLRVPTEKYEATLKEFTMNGIGGTSRDDIESVAQSSNDVTAEYVDAAARVKTLQAARDQLYQLMTSASSVQDVLSVRRELTKVTQDLEARQARMNYLSKQASFSTIDLNIRSQRRPGPPKPSKTSIWNRLVLRSGLSWPQFILRRISRATEIAIAITGLILKTAILIFIYACFILPLAAFLYFIMPILTRFVLRPLQRVCSILLDIIMPMVSISKKSSVGLSSSSSAPSSSP